MTVFCALALLALVMDTGAGDAWPQMPEAPAPLHRLAEAAGVCRTWRDVDGRDHMIEDGRLAAILSALGHGTGSERTSLRSLAEIDGTRSTLPPMIVTDCGARTAIPTQRRTVTLTDENGMSREHAVADGLMSPISVPGYYTMSLDGGEKSLAVCPLRCPLPEPGQRIWGTSVQIPSLRSPHQTAFGSFAALDDAVRQFGQRGAAALAINPVHALFPGQGEGYSPYSPSSRLFLNTALGDTAMLGLPPLANGEDRPLIDWAQAIPQRMAALRAVFDALDEPARTAIRNACAAEGEALQQHALFDALSMHFAARGKIGWQAWPAAYRRLGMPSVARFAHEHTEDISFHLFVQWLARTGLEISQNSALAAGMSIGLISDLAVGVHPGGSDVWRMPEAMLTGLTIGAPPDPLGPFGQNWNITSFSPEGLRRTGYAPWIAMLRAALRSAGGVRIDHAYGLARLWVIPDGGAPADGAYLSYPFHDLVRLATLEAHRADALIIAEDLGTSPPGFTAAISERNMLGMRVLWFERAADHGFVSAHDYPAGAVALTGTHDTVTVTGWWKGRDLDWAVQLGRLPPSVDAEKAEAIRDWDRGLLWSTLVGHAPRPAPDNPGPVVDAVIRHIAKTPSALALVPLEDLAACEEQPNLPGTVTEHPNWRRRMDASLSALLDTPDVARRIDALNQNRG